MKTVEMREKLHHFINVVEEKRMKAIYALFENEIEEQEWEYTDDFKAELDKRYQHFKDGGPMISEAEVRNSTKNLISRIKKDGL